MAGPVKRFRDFIRDQFTRECIPVDDKPQASTQSTRDGQSRRRYRSAPSERFVWAMVLLIIALVGVIVLEAICIVVTKSVSDELAAVISLLTGSLVTAFLMGKKN